MTEPDATAARRRRGADGCGGAPSSPPWSSWSPAARSPSPGVRHGTTCRPPTCSGRRAPPVPSPAPTPTPDRRAGRRHHRPAQHPASSASTRGSACPTGEPQRRRGADPARAREPGPGVPLLPPPRPASSTSRRSPRPRFGGSRTKLTHAMSYGSQVPGTDEAQRRAGLPTAGHRRSAGTPGSPRFDAGAVLNFGGFTKLVDAVGGVDMYVDQRVVSKHREPDGDHRPARPRRLRRPADGLREGHPPPHRLAGAGLRPAALPDRRRLHPAAAPAAAHQGAGRQDPRPRTWPATRSSSTGCCARSATR